MNRVLTIAVIAVAFAITGFTNKRAWIIHANSRLTIVGLTNVNKFICKLEYCTGTDTLQYVENNSAHELRFTRSLMTVPIRSFDCGSQPISRDFRKALRAETYPNLAINFISLQNTSFTEPGNIKGIVDITLAGVTTRYIIRYQISSKANGTVHLKGAHAVKFSDFGLEVPEKLKGLIKVKEGLTVGFDLVLKEV